MALVDSSLDNLLIRDQRMILETYRTLDLDRVAEALNLTRSAVSKRFKVVHGITGQLFEFSRGKVIALAHTHAVVEEIERSLQHTSLSMALSRIESRNTGRVRVNVAAIDHLESMLSIPLAERLKDDSRIQLQFNATSVNLGSDRFQNLFEMVRLLERGDVDILICYDFEKSGVKTENSRLPKLTAMRPRGLADMEAVGLVSPNAKISNPATPEQIKAMKRVAQMPEYAAPGSDIAYIVTNMHAASEIVKADSEAICMPPDFVAHYHAKLYGLKVVKLPKEHQAKGQIKMLWTKATDSNFACKAVRSVIIRYFAEL